MFIRSRCEERNPSRISQLFPTGEDVGNNRAVQMSYMGCWEDLDSE